MGQLHATAPIPIDKFPVFMYNIYNKPMEVLYEKNFAFFAYAAFAASLLGSV